jgi:16S rRNA C1402 (ribose-2'-O) methylase RsmI
VKQLPTALELLRPVLGRRRIVAANNLTTRNQAVLRGRVSELLERFSRNPLEGEVTLIIEGSRKKREMPERTVPEQTNHQGVSE